MAGAIIVDSSGIFMYFKDLSITLEVKLIDWHSEWKYVQSWSISSLATA